MRFSEIVRESQNIIFPAENGFPGTSSYDPEQLGGVILRKVQQLLQPVGLDVVAVGSSARPRRTADGQVIASNDWDGQIDQQHLLQAFPSDDVGAARQLSSAKQQLVHWLNQQGLRARAIGINVHVALPVGKQFVQVDLEVVQNRQHVSQYHLHQIPAGSPCKGKHKQLFLGKLARLQGLMWSAWAGLFRRTAQGKRGELVTSDPDQVAQQLFGAGVRWSQVGDNVEQMIAVLQRINPELLSQALQLAADDPNWEPECLRHMQQLANPQQLSEQYDPQHKRIQHPEDSVFSGAAATRNALAVLRQAAQQPETVSIKPDGRPAIMWGRNSQGEFVMGDKHMWPDLPSSLQQMQQQLATRKTPKPELLALYEKIWSVFESSVPASVQGVFFGDLLYHSTPAQVQQHWQFQPNTVTYRVPVKSQLGQRIARSQAGIMVHTFFAAGSSLGQHITDDVLSQLRPGALLAISDQMPVQRSLPVPAQLTQIQPLLPGLDQLLSAAELRSQRLLSLPALLVQFVNQWIIHQGQMPAAEQLGSEFVSWLQRKSQVSAAQQQRIAEYFQQNAQLVNNMWRIFALLTAAKHQLIAALDQQAAQQLQASTGDVPGQEGFVVHGAGHPVKLVNRFVFSAANLAHLN